MERDFQNEPLGKQHPARGGRLSHGPSTPSVCASTPAHCFGIRGAISNLLVVLTVLLLIWTPGNAVFGMENWPGSIASCGCVHLGFSHLPGYSFWEFLFIFVLTVTSLPDLRPCHDVSQSYEDILIILEKALFLKTPLNNWSKESWVH